MEFKQSYRFRDYLPFAVFFSVLLLGIIALIIWLIVYGISHDEFPDILVAIILLVICFAGGLLIISILYSCLITIDEEKIVLKGLRGTILSYNISDIYKIEVKHGAKGTIVFIIHGNTPQTRSRKSKIETINLLADEKREEILKHFITNPDVWDTDLRTFKILNEK